MILCSFAFDDRSAEDAILDGYFIRTCTDHPMCDDCDDVEDDEESALEGWFDRLARLRTE